MIKLNLGCETDIRKGFVNVDIKESEGVDVVADLNKKLPWKDNSASDILISHVLEHLNNPIEFMKEVYRICKDQANIIIRVPHFSHFTNHADMTHNKDFSYFSFGETWTNKELYPLFEVKKKLNFNRVNHTWMNYIFNPVINLMPTFYERFCCYILPCSEIIFELKVLKKENIKC